MFQNRFMLFLPWSGDSTTQRPVRSHPIPPYLSVPAACVQIGRGEESERNDGLCWYGDHPGYLDGERGGHMVRDLAASQMHRNQDFLIYSELQILRSLLSVNKNILVYIKRLKTHLVSALITQRWVCYNVDSAGSRPVRAPGQ